MYDDTYNHNDMREELRRLDHESDCEIDLRELCKTPEPPKLMRIK